MACIASWTFSLIPMLFSDTGILAGIIYGWEPADFVVLLYRLVVSTFIFAIAEDIVFIGYIQTRLYGLIKNNILAISLGAFLFSIMHISIPLVESGLAAFNAQILLWLLVCFVLHIIMNALFRRYFILFSATIFHTFNNFSFTGRLWVSPEHSTLWTLLAVAVVVLAVGAWALYVRRHLDTTSTEHITNSKR